MTTVWSCGGGTQSAAIALLIETGRLPRPSYAVMVDTEREKTQTWSYLDAWIRPALLRAGVLLYRIPKRFYATVDLYSHSGKLLLPVYTADGGKLPTYCSNEWKQRVIRRWLRKAMHVTHHAEQWIGYSKDEAVERMKDTGVAWLTNRYPLVDLGLSRGDCFRLVVAAGWPEPPRSACWMCPQMKNEEWRHLRDTAPADFQRAVALDAEIRQRDPNVYLHRSGTPLKDADLGAVDPQGDLFGCTSGHCFV